MAFTYYKAPIIHVSTSELKFIRLKNSSVSDHTYILDIFLQIAWPLKTPTPGWSGVWQMISRGSYPGRTSVVFLPMIDLIPSDPSCIFSTMLFVSDQALQHKKTAILTFDQPMYWKAYGIKVKEQPNSHLKKMVLRLGCFYMCMSSLGSIGHIMFGSGLQETFELIYAKNAVPHFLSGKAVSRASRAHMLLETALFTLIQSKSVDTSQEEQPSQGLTTISDETDLSDMSF